MSTDRLANPFDGHALPSPALGDATAAVVLQILFGREGVLTPLGSHQDQNWRVDADDGRFVLKVSNPGFPRSGLEAQNAAMLHLSDRDCGFEAPVPVASVDGELITTWRHEGVAHDVRLVTFVDGTPLADFDHLAPTVVHRHGELAAQAALALDGFDHPGIDRLLQWDTRHAFDVIQALLAHVTEERERALIQRLAQQARAALEPLIPELRTQVVHADVTDVNVVARLDRAGRPMPAGLIDFCDLSRTWVASDVATAIAGLAYHDLERPLQMSMQLVAGYHGELPLTVAEVDAVWPLVLARAAVCQVSSAQQVELDPHSEYASTSLEMDRAIAHSVAAVPIALARECLRVAVGIPPRATASTLVAMPWGPLFESDTALVRVDLSVTSEAIGPGGWHDAALVAAAVEFVAARARPATAHGEARLIDTAEDDSREPASVHLGVDVFAPEGTQVLAPVAGEVVRLDPMTIRAGDAWVRLDRVEPTVSLGEVAQGTAVGVVRPPDGLLPAHVHVQALTDLVDAPPASVPSLSPGWLRVCPDPGPALGLPAPEPRDAATLLVRRRRVVAGVQEHYYEHPPAIERGWRHHLYDTSGRSYLDVVNNVAVLGHSHPAVTDAVARQLRQLNTNSRFNYEAIVAFCERLAARLPDPLDTVLLVSTGSEAVDLALRVSRAATDHEHVIAVRSAYHGWTMGTDAISTSLADNPTALQTRPAWVHTVESPNTYRGEHRGADAAQRYVGDVERALRDIDAAGGGVAAFIAEALYGNAGGVLLPDGYLRSVYERVRDAGGLCIADEVQVGYGRTGHFFWAFEQQDVVPDVVTVAKAAGNGMAVGAVITSRSIADAFASQGSFFSSVGGSPVSARAGATVLQVIEDEKLQANARDVGDHLRARLLQLIGRYPIVGAVHGLGLYLGVELVRDRVTLEPATDECAAICERLLELGIVVQPTSDHLNVLKVKPPLCLTRASADFFVDTLEQVLRTGW
jgi:4-aminobutyrate aminotransferase-like enzyme/Ser/Thr protein kinase RdoA (MazF antagonist)